jgi:hypothetical protein
VILVQLSVFVIFDAVKALAVPPIAAFVPEFDVTVNAVVSPVTTTFNVFEPEVTEFATRLYTPLATVPKTQVVDKSVVPSE